VSWSVERNNHNPKPKRLLVNGVESLDGTLRQAQLGKWEKWKKAKAKEKKIERKSQAKRAEEP
jgi:hypothetical protein